MPLGDYRDWALILPVSRAVADSTGEEVESWPDPPADTTAHAAKIESPSGAESGANVRGSFGGFTLRFRCEVELYAVDRVKLRETGDVYAVTGVWRERGESGGWQTVCTLTGPV